MPRTPPCSQCDHTGTHPAPAADPTRPMAFVGCTVVGCDCVIPIARPAA